MKQDEVARGSFLHWRGAAKTLMVAAMIAGDMLETPRRLLFRRHR